MKKVIQTQRVLSIEDAQREFKNVEDTINKLANATASTTGGTPGPKGDTGAEGPAGAAGAAGATGPPGADGTGATLTPETVSFLVPEAAPGVWSVGETTVAKKALLFRVSSDQSCIVRLYFNAALRDTDAGAGRLPTTNPGPGYILGEVGLDLANGRTQFLSPAPVIYNADDPFTSTIYWAVMQTMLVDVAVNVELYILPLEA